MGLTQEVASFVHRTRFRDVPPEVVGLARGFVLDGLGVILAGSTEKGARIIAAYVRRMGGKAEASVIGSRFAAPAPKAALVNGVAGHAMDYDDTQLSTSKEAVYGLLTHPTIPVLSAALAVGERRSTRAITSPAFIRPRPSAGSAPPWRRERSSASGKSRSCAPSASPPAWLRGSGRISAP